MSEDVFNLLAIRGLTGGEGKPGIKPGSSDPQSHPLTLRHHGGPWAVATILLTSKATLWQNHWFCHWCYLANIRQKCPSPLFKHWIAFCRCSRAIWMASERIATQCMKFCYSFRCNSYGPWTPTKCDSILIFTSFYNKVWRDIAYFNTKMSYLSDSTRTKN